MKNKAIVFKLIAIGCWLAACVGDNSRSKETISNTAAQFSPKNPTRPILDSRCMGCHNLYKKSIGTAFIYYKNRKYAFLAACHEIKHDSSHKHLNFDSAELELIFDQFNGILNPRQ